MSPENANMTVTLTWSLLISASHKLGHDLGDQKPPLVGLPGSGKPKSKYSNISIAKKCLLFAESLTTRAGADFGRSSQCVFVLEIRAYYMTRKLTF